MNKKISYILAPAACMAVIFGLYSGKASAEEKPAEEKAAAQAQQEMVSAGVVESIPYNPVHRYKGRITSPKTVAIVPEVAGKIEKVEFTEGAIVKEGAVLYRIDAVTYDAAVQAAKAQVQQCQANYDLACKTYDRTKVLFERKVTSEQAWDSAISSKAAAEAALNAAKASLISAEDNLNNCTITAPVSGKIGVNKYAVGNYVTTASGALTTIVQQNPLRLAFSMSNRDYLRYYGNENALREAFDIRIRLADGSAYANVGEVEFVDNAANASTDTISIYVSFENAEGRLVPGATVSVDVKAKETPQVTAVPLTAVIRESSDTYVWVLSTDNVPERREVVSPATTEKHAVISSGLTVGERIVTAGTHKVRPGVAVKVAK